MKAVHYIVANALSVQQSLRSYLLFQAALVFVISILVSRVCPG